MEDVLYFTTQQLSIDDIARIAEEQGFKTTTAPAGVTIYSSDRQKIIWNVYPFGQEYMEEAERELVQREGWISSFCISHHPRDSSEFFILATALLQRFGGWIANADDLFEPRFDLENIASFRYSF